MAPQKTEAGDGLGRLMRAVPGSWRRALRGSFPGIDTAAGTGFMDPDGTEFGQ